MKIRFDWSRFDWSRFESRFDDRSRVHSDHLGRAAWGSLVILAYLLGAALMVSIAFTPVR